jgi:uncharacterized membrane protein YgcG
MEEENTSTMFKEIKDDVSKYVKNTIELTKLSAYEKISKATSEATYSLILACIILFVLFIASITLAIYLGEILMSLWAGFGLVALLNIVLIIILLLLRKPIKKSITNKVVSFLTENDEEEGSKTYN